MYKVLVSIPGANTDELVRYVRDEISAALKHLAGGRLCDVTVMYRLPQGRVEDEVCQPPPP